MAVARNRERERKRVESSSSSRMMDHNAPPNSWTFGNAQWKFGLSSGLSNWKNSSGNVKENLVTEFLDKLVNYMKAQGIELKKPSNMLDTIHIHM